MQLPPKRLQLLTLMLMWTPRNWILDTVHHTVIVALAFHCLHTNPLCTSAYATLLLIVYDVDSNVLQCAFHYSNFHEFQC